MPDLSDTIESEAALPASSSVDGQSATGRSIDEIIKADKYLKGGTALDGTNAQGGPRSAWGCTRPAKVIPPGSV